MDVVFCGGSEPEWVAFQDGDGAWTRALPSVAAQTVTFRHAFVANRGAIATARRINSATTTLDVQYGAPSELTIVGVAGAGQCGPTEPRTLLGAVAGLGAGDVAFVSGGRGVRDVVFPDEVDGFTLRGLVAGPQEILATRATQASLGTTLTSIILRRSAELPDNATLPVLDFSSPEAFQPVVRNVTIDGLGPDGAIAQTGLHTAHSDVLVTFLTDQPAAATRPYYALPESRLQAGELQRLTATAAPSVEGVRRGATVYFRTPVDLTLTLGPTVAPPAVSLEASAPTLRLRARFAPQGDYDRLAAIAFQQGTSTLVSVAMTTAYAALTGGTYDLVVPELTSVQGFDATWALHAGTPVLWTANRVGGTLGLGANAVPTDGASSRVVVITGGFTQP